VVKIVVIGSLVQETLLDIIVCYSQGKIALKVMTNQSSLSAALMLL